MGVLAQAAALGCFRRDARVDKAAVAGAARHQTRVRGPLLRTSRGATACPRSSVDQASSGGAASSGGVASGTRAAVDASPGPIAPPEEVRPPPASPAEAPPLLAPPKPVPPPRPPLPIVLGAFPEAVLHEARTRLAKIDRRDAIRREVFLSMSSATSGGSRSNGHTTRRPRDRLSSLPLRRPRPR